jgi:hypothetical protein
MYVSHLIYTQFWLAPDLPEYNLYKLGNVCIQKIEIPGNLLVLEGMDKPAYSPWQLIQVLKAWIISCAVSLLDIASKLFSISRCSVVIFILNLWECYSTSQYYTSLAQSLVTTIRLEAKYSHRFIQTWFTIEQKIFKVFCINTQGHPSNQVPPPVFNHWGSGVKVCPDLPSWQYYKTFTISH